MSAPFLPRRSPDAPEAEPVVSERVDVRGLPVPPLDALMAGLRAEVPSLRGLALQDGVLTAMLDADADPQVRTQLRDLLSDPDLRAAAATEPATTAARQERDDLSVLRDDDVSDTEWLRAFRRYAVTHLLPSPEDDG